VPPLAVDAGNIVGKGVGSAAEKLGQIHILVLSLMDISQAAAATAPPLEAQY
jgi:hypothetical protein